MAICHEQEGGEHISSVAPVNVDLREIKELEEVVKDTVTDKSKQKSVMITIDGFECESWLDISCGVSSYNGKGFLSYTFYAEHIED